MNMVLCPMMIKVLYNNTKSNYARYKHSTGQRYTKFVVQQNKQTNKHSPKPQQNKGAMPKQKQCTVP